jgi:hypothetical protein
MNTLSRAAGLWHPTSALHDAILGLRLRTGPLLKEAIMEILFEELLLKANTVLRKPFETFPLNIIMFL